MRLATSSTGTTGPAPWVFDVLLGIGVMLTVSWLIAANVGGTGADGWAYLWAVGLGALMLVRRRVPLLVAIASGAAVIGYHAVGYPPIGVAVPLAAAVFSAAEFGRTIGAVLVSAAVIALALYYRLSVGQDPGFVVGYELPSQALLLLGAVAFGDSVRSRRQLRHQSARIAAMTAERVEQEAERRVMSERLEIARELHDSVGHALTVVSLHGQVLDESLPDDDDEARRSLRAITDTTSATFADLRRTVQSLRSEQGAPRSPLRLSDLQTVLRPAEQAGMTVTSRVEVDSELPPTVEAAVYRIVQESVVNVVRHADASSLDVAVLAADGRVTVTIANDGGARGPVRKDGNGIAGMRERAQLLGGTFSAGPTGAGFEVRAVIPIEAERETD